MKLIKLVILSMSILTSLSLKSMGKAVESYTPLMRAIKSGSIENVRESLRLTSDILETYSTYSALMLSIMQGKNEIIEMLLNEINRRVKANPELAPLFYADVENALKKLAIVVNTGCPLIETDISMLRLFDSFAQSHLKESPRLKEKVNEIWQLIKGKKVLSFGK